MNYDELHGKVADAICFSDDPTDPEGGHLDRTYLDNAAAAIRVVIEVLAQEAEHHVVVSYHIIGGETRQKLADWLRSHLPESQP